MPHRTTALALFAACLPANLCLQRLCLITTGALGVVSLPNLVTWAPAHLPYAT